MDKYFYETRDGVRYQVDTDTGEMSVRDSRYRQPIRVRSIKNREDYDKAIADARGKSKWRLVVGELTLDVVVGREVSLPALCVFCALGRSVGFNNITYTSTKELSSSTSHSRQTVQDSLSELKRAGLLKEADWIKEKGGRLFFLNPLYFFLGYYPYRDQLIKKWWDDIIRHSRDGEGGYFR